MRNFVKFSLLALVAVATTASAAELEFHGYTRAGIALNTKGGGGVCFGLDGADVGNIRLGNECDYVIEPTFIYKFTTLEDKSSWGVTVMPSIYRAWADNNSGLPVGFGQIYFHGQNVPQLLNGTIWGGRRFYDRLQTGINDQFLENEDGDGAGIENMDLGFAKWSVAWLMDPNGGENDKQMKLTTRLTDIKTVEGGALQLWAAIKNLQSKSEVVGGAEPGDVDSTFRVGVYHTWNLGDWGSNLIAFKYNTALNTANEAKINTWRVLVQHGITFASARTSLDAVAEFVSSKNDDADAVNQFLVMARTDTQISGPFRFLLEAGYNQIMENDDRDSASLLKITPVLAVSGGNDPWSRPTFRLYYTFASWNEEGVLGGARTNNVFGDKKSGGSFGIQAEGWW